MTDNDVALRKSYDLFKNRISGKDFQERLNSMGESEKESDVLKWNFIRSCKLFRYACDCEKVSLNVSTLLLCCSVEAISSNHPSTIVFKNWLIKNKVKELSNKDRVEIERNLNQFYDEYCSNEDSREGASFNFKKFLSQYCPEDLKRKEVIIELIKKDNHDIEEKQLDFEDVLYYIYSQYRSNFVHRGIARVQTPEESEIYLFLADVYKKKDVQVEFDHNWFKAVVFESLFNYLPVKQ